MPRKKKKTTVAVESHIPCPMCSSSDAYTVYDDGHGWCHSCNKGVFPQGVKLKPEDLEAVYHNEFRGINSTVCEFLNIKTYVDEGGHPIFREYVYPTGSKFRNIADKKFWMKGKVPALGGTHLFNAGSAHYITVVEGEEDAAAAYQMLNDGKKTVYPVVWLTSASIPNGAREEIYAYLSKFTTVKLAFEDDAGGSEAGLRAKQILAEMLPNKIREVPLTKHKDANDYLINGDEKEFTQAWTNASIYTTEGIYHTEEDVKAILSDDETGSYIETPFPDLNKLIKGVSLNCVTLITGMEGLGKTELLRALEYEVVATGTPIAVLHHEETKKTIYKGYACYELWQNCRDPDNPVPIDTIADAVGKMSDGFNNLFVFEFKNDPDVNIIMEKINYLVKVCGVKYIFMDPINQFSPTDGKTTHVEFLDDLSKRLAKYVAENNVGVVITAHVDDEGRTRNSRMISKECSVRIDVDRDHLSEDADERNTTHLMVSKNRPFSTTGPAGSVYFDPDVFVMYSGWIDKNETGKVVDNEKEALSEITGDIIPF